MRAQKEDSPENQRKRELINNELILDQLKSHLKHFERMVRVFEMTYLDLTKKLKEDIKDKNLEVKPVEVQKDLQINDKGQVIFDQSHQLFDANANLIDKESKVHKR